MCFFVALPALTPNMNFIHLIATLSCNLDIRYTYIVHLYAHCAGINRTHPHRYPFWASSDDAFEGPGIGRALMLHISCSAQAMSMRYYWHVDSNWTPPSVTMTLCFKTMLYKCHCKRQLKRPVYTLSCCTERHGVVAIIELDPTCGENASERSVAITYRSAHQRIS